MFLAAMPQSWKILKTFRSASPLLLNPLVMLPSLFTQTQTFLCRSQASFSLPQRGHMTGPTCMALNWPPSCSPKVKLWPSRGQRLATTSRRRHQSIAPLQPPSTGRQPTRAWVSRVFPRFHSPTSLPSRPCRICLLSRPHPPHPLLLGFTAIRSLRWHQTVSPSRPPSLRWTGSQRIRTWVTRVCPGLCSHSPTFLRPCRICSLTRPHPLRRPLLGFRDNSERRYHFPQHFPIILTPCCFP